MFSQESIGASWGPLWNLSTGKIVIDEQTFSLVPNALATGVILSVGKDAYSIKKYPIEDIAGYKNGFMAWMTIKLRNGEDLKLSIGRKSQKLSLIKLLEQRRMAFFMQRGQEPPQLSSII